MKNLWIALFVLVLLSAANGLMWGLIIEDTTTALIISALTGGAIGWFGMGWALENVDHDLY
jgi:hypothetical protein